MASLSIITSGAAPAEASGVLLCLHGLGVDATDLAPLGDELGLDGWHFVFPHAPLDRPEGGRVWYPQGPGKHEGIAAASESVRAELEWLEAAGVASGRLAILGFSQGSVVGLHAALRFPRRLGAAVGLSGYLYAPEAIAAEAHLANADLPLFLAHGTGDPLLPVEGAREAAEFLVERGYPAEYHEYAIGHEICDEEIDAVRRFLTQALLPSRSG